MPKISRDSFLVGDIRQSMLTENDIHDLVGSDQIWVLMDGRDVTGSSYAEITGRTGIPDISGCFLRGAIGSSFSLNGVQDFQTVMNSNNFGTNGVTNNAGGHSHNMNSAGATTINIGVNNVGNHSHLSLIHI